MRLTSAGDKARRLVLAAWCGVGALRWCFMRGSFIVESAQAAEHRGGDGIGTLLNGITTGVSPMTLSQHPMDHARERARSTTAKGGRCSRKLALLFFTPTHAQFLPCRVAGPPA